MRTFLGLALAALVAGLLLALTAGQALASHVQCGDVITQDTTLDSDLLGCAYPALTIAGDDVTLDLKRHVVEGGMVTPSNGDSFTGLAIENGTVRGGGISIYYYEDVTIQHLTVDGIRVGASAVQIEHSAVRGSSYGDGVSVGRGGVTISDSLIERNNGLGISASHGGATLFRNTIRANGGGIGGGQGGDFIAVANRIVGNRGNGVAGNETSFMLRNNRIARNGGDGVHAEFIGLQAQGNTVTRNGGAGIYAAIGNFQLTGNTTSRNVEDGIRIGERAQGTLTANAADRNGDDGIDVDGPVSMFGPIT